MANERMVWIDCEMTGLDLEKDALIEVAVLVTDAQLEVLGDGVQVVIKPPDAAVEQMDDFVRTMHVRSGLLEDLPHGITMDEALGRIMAYVRTYVPEARKVPLAGNSVHMDRLFLARDLPELETHLHYRNVDVSSIKELVRRWYPRVYFQTPPKTGNHRARGDIKDSIEELRYYRRCIFVPPPGPDSEAAKAISAALVAERPAQSPTQSPAQSPAQSKARTEQPGDLV